MHIYYKYFKMNFFQYRWVVFAICRYILVSEHVSASHTVLEVGERHSGLIDSVQEVVFVIQQTISHSPQNTGSCKVMLYKGDPCPFPLQKGKENWLVQVIVK